METPKERNHSLQDINALNKKIKLPQLIGHVEVIDISETPLRKEPVTGKPYTDEQCCGFILRTFYEGISSSELIWHRDAKDRSVTVLLGSGWKLQMDNELPVDLIPRRSYNIPKETFHRIIKGSSSLLLKIVEK